MKKIVIVNGPNLNLLGSRQTNVYGDKDWDTYFQELQTEFSDHELLYFQSNDEGELVNVLQEYGDDADGIVLNAGAYSHTSVAIADAVGAIKAKVICVHISLVHKRGEFRHEDLVQEYSDGYISGLGLDGYKFAIEVISNY
jgi:3-dehydroquinate dehydratase-2